MKLIIKMKAAILVVLKIKRKKIETINLNEKFIKLGIFKSFIYFFGFSVRDLVERKHVPMWFRSMRYVKQNGHLTNDKRFIL